MRTRYFVSAEKAFVDTTAPVICVVVGESGYYPIFTAQTADTLNGTALPESVLTAAVIGSMFGWDVPGAKDAVEYAG